MKRLLPPLFTLLLATAVGHAHATPDATACKPRYAALDPGAIQEASTRLAAARGQPGEQQLALADALANLALLSARQTGSADIATDGNPAPAELLRQSLAIWNAAPPSAALASALQAQGLAFFDSRQCLLGREVLESALRVSSAAAGPNAPASVAIAQDLLRVGLAQRDDALVRRLAPAATAALDARSRPLDPRDQQTLLDLVDFFYSRPGDGRQDLQQAEHLAQRGLALTTPGTTPGTAASARRVLSYRLASIYYAQLRYADAEALRTQLASGQPAPPARKDEFGRQREELIALVRKGELYMALRKALALVDRQQQALNASRRALAEAEAARVKLQESRSPATSVQEQAQALDKIAQAGRAVGQARARQSAETISLAQARSYLGEIRHAMGDVDAAASAYEAALAGFDEVQGRSLEDRARTRADLALVCRIRGDYARALTLQQQVLDELLPLVGEDHPDVKEARAELALLHKLQQG